MPMRPLRSLERPHIQTAASEWLSQIDSPLADTAANRALGRPCLATNTRDAARANTSEPQH